MNIGRGLIILVVLNALLLFRADFSIDFLLSNLLPANLIFIGLYAVIYFARNKLAKRLGQTQDVPLERGEIRRQKQELLHNFQDISQAVFIPDDIKARLEEKIQSEITQISRYARETKRSHRYVFVSFLMNSLLEFESKELEEGSVEKAAQIRGIYQRLVEYDKTHPST